MLQISNPEWIAHRLVLAHQPLARKIARGYAFGGLNFDDLLSAANVGLLEAAKRFDEDRGCPFGAYATSWAQAECRQFVLMNASIVKRPRPTPGQKLEIPSDSCLSTAIEGNGSAVGDLLPAEDNSPEHDLAEREIAAEKTGRLAAAIATLSDREKQIFVARRLQEKPTELKTLAQRFMVSLERVRQIEVGAFKKVQNRIAKQPLAPKHVRLNYARRLRDATLASPPKDPTDIILRHAVMGSFGFDLSPAADCLPLRLEETERRETRRTAELDAQRQRAVAAGLTWAVAASHRATELEARRRAAEKREVAE